MKTRKDIRTRDGYNDVGDIHIRYDINQPTGKPVSGIRAFIERNGEKLGTVTDEVDGRLYISFDYANDIVASQKQEVLKTILLDTEDVFNELTDKQE